MEVKKTVKCSKGHFYDAAKNPMGCPYCAGSFFEGADDLTRPLMGGGMYQPPNQQNLTPINPGGFAQPSASTYSQETMPYEDPGVTVPIEDVWSNPENTAPANKAKVEEVQEEDDYTTPSVWDEDFNNNIQPVVGWLVGIKGECRGSSFELRAGKSFIGRSASNDVVIPGDSSISREKHAIVIFEPNQSMYFIQPGMSNELCYLNQSCVLTPMALKSHDIISLGKSEFIFVPLCGEDFSWKNV